jgi:GxxExxY protein
LPAPAGATAQIDASVCGAAVAVDVGMLLDDSRLNDLTGTILGAAIEVHRILGPGLFETVYQACLEFELRARGLRFTVEQPLPINYKTLQLKTVYKMDLLVEDLVIVEIKSVEALLPVHKAQVITHMRLSGKPSGLLINFNVARLMDGVKRVLNTRNEQAGVGARGFYTKAR